MLIDSLCGGGAEKLINDIAPRFKNHGYYVEILILTDKNDKYKSNLEKEGINVLVLDSNLGHISKMFEIGKIISKGNFDVIHANLFPMTYYIALISCFMKHRNFKLVMTEHNTDNRRRHIVFFRPLERFIYKKYDNIISISLMTQEKLKEWLKLTSKYDNRFCVINNGVPIREFSSAEKYEKNYLFQEYQTDDILIAMIGSFTKQKNHLGMLGILEKLPYRYKLILAGEGPLMNEIQDVARQRKLLNRIVFLGFRADIARILQTIDILVIPSLWEGFGLIAVEAMACGKPIVASNVPGLAEVVDTNGLLAESNCVDDFVNQILRLEDNDTYRYYAIKSKKGAKEYDIENMVEKYEIIYERK